MLPDPKAVAKGVAGMALKTVNPLFLALPLLSLGSDEPPCPIAIAVAEGRQPPKGASPAAGGGAPAQQAPSGPADAVKGLFDGLKKLVP